MIASNKEPKSPRRFYVFSRHETPEYKFQKVMRSVLDYQLSNRVPREESERYFTERFGVAIEFYAYQYGQMNFELSEEDAVLFLLKWA